MNMRILLGAAAAGALTTASAALADPLPAPSMTPPLAANANPFSLDAGPLGKLYFGGAVSGLGMYQDHHAGPIAVVNSSSIDIVSDHETQADFTNAQVWVEKTDGPIQGFAEFGGYSFPSLGTAYVPAHTMVNATFGVMPVGYIKLAPSSSFNLIAGKLPTLIGAEYGFTFQNMNINRGLLWNQEPLVSRGVQANLTKGKVAVSVSWNDGFYSSRYNWVSGLVTLTLTPSDTLAFGGGGNLGTTPKSTFATPIAQNNSAIVNVMYTHTQGPWTFGPYVQYTHVPANADLGVAHAASTWGGAILAKYSITPQWSVAGRAEYISSTGTVANGAPSLLYGPGSKAWSLTVTPTFQKKIWFVRGELAYVKVLDATPGSALGANFTDTSQVRAAVETGLLF